MKIRSGFVSNSSSTAYILIFDKPIETIKQMRKELFGDTPNGTYNYDHIAERVLRDLDEPNNWDRLLSEMVTKVFSNEIYSYEKDKYYKKQRSVNWKNPKYRFYCRLYQIKQRTKAKKLLMEYCEKYDLKNRCFYCVEYEDSSGEYYYHNGEPFQNIDYINISHH